MLKRRMFIGLFLAIIVTSTVHAGFYPFNGSLQFNSLRHYTQCISHLISNKGKSLALSLSLIATPIVFWGARKWWRLVSQLFFPAVKTGTENKNQLPPPTQKRKKIKKFIDDKVKIQDECKQAPKKLPDNTIEDFAQANNHSPFDCIWGEPGTWQKKPISKEAKKIDNNLLIQQKPSLCQRRNALDQTNLCGYYAIVNAISAYKNVHQDRTCFVQNFATMLQSIAKKRGIKKPYTIEKFDNLENDEIQNLLKEQNLIDKILIIDQHLVAANREILENFGYDPQQIKLLNDFASGTTKSISAIYLIPKGANHYIAIKAQKKHDLLNVYVYDSLGKNYLEEHMIKNRILPLCDTLTTKKDLLCSHQLQAYSK